MLKINFFYVENICEKKQECGKDRLVFGDLHQDVYFLADVNYQVKQNKNIKILNFFINRIQDWADQSFEEIKWAHRWMSLENKEHQYVSKD